MRWLAVIYYTDGSWLYRWGKSRRKVRKWAHTVQLARGPYEVSGVAVVNVAK